MSSIFVMRVKSLVFPKDNFEREKDTYIVLSNAAEVLMFVSIRAEPMALVREWSLESCRQDWSRATWKMLESIVFVPLEDLLSPVVFSHCRDSRAITLIPRWHS